MAKEEILNYDEKFRYLLLGKMKQDCLYYLGNGHRNIKYLWALDEKEHIEIMKAIHNSFPKYKKPKWLSMKEIDGYAKAMINDKEQDKERARARNLDK